MTSTTIAAAKRREHGLQLLWGAEAVLTLLDQWAGDRILKSNRFEGRDAETVRWAAAVALDLVERGSAEVAG